MLLNCDCWIRLKNALDCKIKPVNPKEYQSWIIIGRTDADAEAPIRWLPDAKYWLTGKDSDIGKEWVQEEKVETEDEMIGWYHQLNGHEFEQTLGVAKSQTWLSNWMTTRGGEWEQAAL